MIIMLIGASIAANEKVIASNCNKRCNPDSADDYDNEYVNEDIQYDDEDHF